VKIFYNVAGEINSFKMELEDGGMLVLPSEATKRMVMIFKP